MRLAVSDFRVGCRPPRPVQLHGTARCICPPAPASYTRPPRHVSAAYTNRGRTSPHKAAPHLGPEPVGRVPGLEGLKQLRLQPRHPLRVPIRVAAPARARVRLRRRPLARRPAARRGAARQPQLAPDGPAGTGRFELAHLPQQARAHRHQLVGSA
jgi:hypothetical protein